MFLQLFGVLFDCAVYCRVCNASAPLVKLRDFGFDSLAPVVMYGLPGHLYLLTNQMAKWRLMRYRRS